MLHFDDPYGHTPLEKAFGQGDVYGVGYDAERAARRALRLGMIGAGGVAQSKYFPAIARLRTLWEPIEIVAIAEPRSDHAAKLQAIYGGHWYSDYQTLLSEEAAALDGMLVLSPNDLHAEHTLACLDAGLPVLVEKPIALNLQDAARMCQAADAQGQLLMTVANKRFSPPYQRAKQLITSGVIANPALLAGKFNLGYAYVDLLEAGTIHLFDLALFLMGAVQRVSAAGTRMYLRGPGYPFDNAVLTLEFASGAVGTLYTSATALSFKPWERVEVYGDHAWMTIEDQNELIVYNDEQGGAQSWRPVISNTLLFDEEFGGYMGVIENFAQVIRGAETARVTGWDGYRAYELLSAVHLSLLRHTPVTLPLDAVSADAEITTWLQSYHTKGAE